MSIQAVFLNSEGVFRHILKVCVLLLGLKRPRHLYQRGANELARLPCAFDKL